MNTTACWFSVLAICLAPGFLAAQGEDVSVDRAAREIFETVLSPYCPGRTISNCPSPQADDLRENIKQQLASGESPEEVKDSLYAVFGDELRTVPRARGFGLMAWLVPGLAFLIGGWVVVLWMRRTTQDAKKVPSSVPAELDAEADARLNAELAELDQM